jgi:glycosyltransferase involved in cell wall biosynthesis
MRFAVKVVQLVSGTGLNGAVRHCHELTLQLVDRGIPVVLAHKPGAWIAKNKIPDGVELLETTFRRTRSELSRMAQQLRTRQVDVIHSHMSSAHFFGVLLARLHGFRSVATSHMTFFQPHWWWNDRVIAPSQATARFQRWVNAVPRSRIDVIPNFIDPGRLRPQRDVAEMRQELRIADDAFVITIVGEVSKRKAQHVLLRALPELIAAQVNPHVLLIGRVSPDYETFLHDEIQRLQLHANVSILGMRHDVADLLHATDCCCLSSNREVLPISLLEAMSVGLPAISTAVGGVAESIREGIDGFVVKRNRPRLLADRLLQLALDPKLRGQMGHSAQKSMQQSFSPQACVPRIIASYQAACRATQRAAAA